jgi:hypothetical protein
MVYPSDMTEPPQLSDAKDSRAERLAAALRENLKRRKAQARAKERQEAPPEETGREP